MNAGERRFETQLAKILERVVGCDGRIDTFEDAGVLADNAGLIVTLASGRQFELTIVQSRGRKKSRQTARN